MVSVKSFQGVWPSSSSKLKQDDIHLNTWSGKTLQVICTIVTLHYEDETYQLPLLLVQISGLISLGRNSFGTLGIKVSGIHHSRGGSDITRLQQGF